MKISINLTGPERKACIDCVMGLQDNENDQGLTKVHASQLAEVVRLKLEEVPVKGGALVLDIAGFGLLEYTLEVWGERKEAARALLKAIGSAPDVAIK